MVEPIQERLAAKGVTLCLGDGLKAFEQQVGQCHTRQKPADRIFKQQCMWPAAVHGMTATAFEHQVEQRYHSQQLPPGRQCVQLML
jgi:hypothetical protein